MLNRPTFLPVPELRPEAPPRARSSRESLLYEGQRVLPDALVDAGYEFQHTDLEPTLARTCC